MEFQEKYKIDIAAFSATGTTTERISPYFDMRDFRRIDFIFAGSMPMSTISTAKQTYTLRLLQASDATGGGASAITTATAVINRPAAASALTTAEKVTELLINFTNNLNDSAMGDTFSINGRKFLTATANSAAYYFAGGSSANATVASEGFKTAFNNTNNTLSSVWEAATDVPASPYIYIRPKDQNNATYITATFTTKIPCGISKAMAHIGVDQQFMGDGKRYVAIGVKATSTALPFSVLAVREYNLPPVSQKTMIVSKSLSASTTK